jgi:hypothetical protein
LLPDFSPWPPVRVLNATNVNIVLPA